MNVQSLLIALTIVNGALLACSIARPGSSEAQSIVPVLRGRALEIVDEQGRVRASITLFPADPTVKMPDGTTGYPETVLLRLIGPNGRPNVKIEANERGGGVGLGGRTDPTYATLSARGENAVLKLTNQDGSSQEWKP